MNSTTVLMSKIEELAQTYGVEAVADQASYFLFQHRYGSTHWQAEDLNDFFDLHWDRNVPPEEIDLNWVREAPPEDIKREILDGINNHLRREMIDAGRCVIADAVEDYVNNNPNHWDADGKWVGPSGISEKQEGA